MAGACLHELFEKRASQTPEAIAVACAGEDLTYAALNERANRLAHYLQDRGVGPDTLVGICLRRSLDLIVGLLGILKAGGAYVPLPPDHPPSRLAHIVRDSRIRIVVTRGQEELNGLNRLNGHNSRALTPVCLDRDSDAIARQKNDNPSGGAHSNNLVYVIYTSGSTGAPKGVAVEHQALVNHCLTFGAHFDLSASDRVLQFAPLSFDVSAEEIFPTLLAGGCVVLRPELAMASIADFHAIVRDAQISILNLPTSYWNEWMKEIERQGSNVPPSLRLVIAGSETVTMRQFARWRRLAGKRIRWCNAYGTTETVITSTFYEPDGEEFPVNVPIGRPLQGTDTYVLNERRLPTVNGESGELYIAGDKLARGYLNEPALTASHFVSDPFSARNKARMCRTGDWVRRRADGNLEFLGRRDHQVNLRGFRIELGEIESALVALPEVSEAVVVARGNAGANKRLVAYIVPTAVLETAGNEKGPRSVGELRQLLKQRLPSYMIPAGFVPMDALPRHSNGKVNRHALPEPEPYRRDLEDSLIPPADSLEDKLAAIWRDVLSLDTVGVEDNFFDLGGHSLHAARVVGALNTLSGQKLQLRALHESPTIRQLATRLRQSEPLRTPSSLTALQPGGSRPPLFLVHGAGGGMLWGYSNLARHLGSDQPVYCFNSRGLEGLEEHSSIEEMARQYVSDLREFRPAGPYHLGGYCFGGEVAFEMAQQLEAQGERVELLVLINAMPPNSPFENPRFALGLVVPFIQNASRWLRHFFHWPARARQNFFQRKFRSLTRRITRLLRLGDGASPLADTSERIDLSPYAEKQRRLWDTHLRASSQYYPRPYDGNVLVIHTPIYPLFCTFDPAFGWGDFVKGRLTLKVVPGAHESILDEPYVREVARELRVCLGDVINSPTTRQTAAVLSRSASTATGASDEFRRASSLAAAAAEDSRRPA